MKKAERARRSRERRRAATIHLDCTTEWLESADRERTATSTLSASSLHLLPLHEIALAHSESRSALQNRNGDASQIAPGTASTIEPRGGVSRSASPHSGSPSPPRIRSRRGWMVVVCVVLLIAVAVGWSASLLQLEVTPLLLSGLSVLAIVMVVYVAALIAFAIFFERRRRARSLLKPQTVIQ